MRTTKKKTVWIIFMLQLLLLHILILYRCSYLLDTLSWRVSAALGLPSWFYDKGTLAVVLALHSVSIAAFFIQLLSHAAKEKKQGGKARQNTRYQLFLLLCNDILWFQPLSYIARHFGKKAEAAVRPEDPPAGQDKNSEKHTWSAERLLLCVFALEFCLLGMKAGETALKWYRNAKGPGNPYESYPLPDSYTDAAISAMLPLTPVSEDAYYDMWKETDDAAAGTYEELPYEANGPWQVRLKNENRYAECLPMLFERYLGYFDSPQTVLSYEDESYVNLETVYDRLLAGGRDDAVFAAIFKQYIPADSLGNVQGQTEGRTELVRENGEYYAYYPVALHIRRVKPHVFELAGIADMYDTLTAFQKEYPGQDFTDVPVLRLRYSLAQDNETWLLSTSDGSLRMRGPDSADFITVPVSLEELFHRGDTMDGVLTSLQEGSYQCDDRKQIFAYGGSYAHEGGDNAPVMVVYYDRETGDFHKSTVTTDYNSRRLFLSFPENKDTGYLVLTTERVMWQEGTVIFKTTDGGETWEELGVAGPDFNKESHSLTTDMCFLTNDVGFLSIRDSEYPELWRTGDGGLTWQKARFDTVLVYYSMAYAPEWHDGEMTLYVGMEEYSKYGGKKAYFTSNDEGVTWKFRGFAMRK